MSSAEGFDLLVDQMKPDHEKKETAYGCGCALLIALVTGACCFGGALSIIGVLFFRGPWWE